MKTLLTFAFLAVASTAVAQQCSNATLTGAFAYTTDTTATVEGKTATNSQVGRVVFDGKGKFTVRVASTTAAEVTVGEASGDYLVGSDCTMTGKTAEGLEFDGVVVNGGSDFYIMTREPGITSAGGGTKIDAQGTCSAATLSGSFGYFTQGTLTVESALVSLGELGVLNFDGRGTATGTYSASSGGLVERKSYDGKYEVGGDCTGNAKFTINGAAYIMNFTVASSGNAFGLSIGGGGSVLTGQATRLFPK